MNVLEKTKVFRESIIESKKERDGAAAVRAFTIYEEVTYYLIGKGKLNFRDDSEKLMAYINKYSISALYKVAETHCKNTGRAPLNYTQDIYYNPQMTLQGAES